MLWMIQITKANRDKSSKAKAPTLSTADGFTEQEQELCFAGSAKMVVVMKLKFLELALPVTMELLNSQ